MPHNLPEHSEEYEILETKRMRKLTHDNFVLTLGPKKNYIDPHRVFLSFSLFCAFITIGQMHQYMLNNSPHCT